MTYLVGAAAGLLYGGLAGLLKHCLRLGAEKRNGDSMKQMYIYFTLSMLINIAVLLSIYFLRNVLPWSFTAMLIAAAVALSLFSKLSPLLKAKKTEQNDTEQ